MNLLDYAARNNGFRCNCNNKLTFEPAVGGVIACHCERCKRRSELGFEGSGHVVYVRGHGKSEQAAYDSWRSSVDSM